MELPSMKFYYRNYKGECGIRSVKEPVLYYGKTTHHPKMQWIMRAFDEDKQDFREFAVIDILNFL